MADGTVNIISVLGGLGNQMFQYAFLYSLHIRYPKEKHYIDLAGLNVCRAHNGYELDRVFAVGKDKELPSFCREWINGVPAEQIEYVVEQAASFYQCIGDTVCPVRILTGYWQTDLYFKGIEKEIRKVFRFPKMLLNEKTGKVAQEIGKCLSVSIHIRRQDYLLPNSIRMYGNICTLEYYDAALEMLCKQFPSDKLYIYLFSDDPEWVKENVKYKNSRVIDWNHKEDSWQDMYLISLCRYHIIANSSFSWWGAWLDERRDKIVIAPNVWLSTRLTPDILPETWKSPFYMEKQWIDIVHHNVTSIPVKGLFHGQMGLIVFFFHYARIKDVSYMQTADRLLDSLMNSMTKDISDNYSDGLAGIGTAIVHLLKNGFVEGDADEILFEIDEKLTLSISYFSENNLDLSGGLCGWLRYFRFRLQKSCVMNEPVFLRNKQSLFYGLCGLEKFKGVSLSVRDDIVSELGMIGFIGLYPEKIEKLLRFFLHDPVSSYATLLKEADRVNKKRIDSISMDRSFGLRGLAGKELQSFSVQTAASWIELV